MSAEVARVALERVKHALTADESDAITEWLDCLDGAERFATHDPGVDWPSDRHTDPVEAIMAALDTERERRASESRPSEIQDRDLGGQVGDHAQTALQHVDRADDWANRDSVRDAEARYRIVDYNLKLALIHAVLSVAQQVNYITARKP